MEFKEWIWKVCEYMASQSRLKEHDEQYFYERINLTDAKLAFIDNVAPEEYKGF